MEWTPWKGLFWNANGTVVEFMINIARSVICDKNMPWYKNMLNYDNGNKWLNLTTI